MKDDDRSMYCYMLALLVAGGIVGSFFGWWLFMQPAFPAPLIDKIDEQMKPPIAMHAPDYFCITDLSQFDSAPPDGETFFQVRPGWIMQALFHKESTFQKPLKIIRIN